MMWWEWLVFAILVVIVVALLVGASLQVLVNRCPNWLEAVIFAVAGGLLANALTSVMKDISIDALPEALYKERWTGLLGLFLLVISGKIVYNRTKRVKRLETEHETALDKMRTRQAEALEKLRREHRDEWTNFLQIDLLQLLLAYGRALRLRDPVKQKEEIRVAQSSTIGMASRFVGKTAGKGTRACLYRVDKAEKKLVPVNGGHAGRPPACRKSFDADHGTYKDIIENVPVWEPGIPDAEAAEQHLTYKTYIAYPVSYHPDDIYGALMVDCPNAGDLDKQVDTAKVAVLAGLLAATFHVLKTP